MGEGLKRARAAAKATRTRTCPVCGKPVMFRVQALKPRLSVHGPTGNRCKGSGTEVKDA